MAEQATEHLVVIDAGTPLGAFLLGLKGKIGGATSAVTCAGVEHPLIVCSALDLGSSAPFVRLTHLMDPPAPEPAQELLVPSKCILFVAVRPTTPGAKAGQLH